MASELNLQVEDRLFQAALRELAEAKNKPYSEVVKSNARLIAVNLAFQTQPFGADASTKEKGERAVRRDLKKVYADAASTFEMLRQFDQKMADAFYAAMEKKNWKEAQRILNSSSSTWRNLEVVPFDESHHRRSRNRRGNVSRHVPAQVVSTGASKLRTYTSKRVRMVGFAKAGWAAAASALTGNTRGIPQFVTRHKAAAPGRARDNSGSPFNPHVTLTNEVKYINTVCSPQQIAAALSIQQEKMLASIKKVVDGQTARFNRRRS